MASALNPKPETLNPKPETLICRALRRCRPRASNRRSGDAGLQKRTGSRASWVLGPRVYRV